MEFLAESLPTVLQALPLYQAHRQFNTAYQHQNKLHTESISHANELHQNEINLARKLHDEQVELAHLIHEKDKTFNHELHRETLTQNETLHKESKDFSYHLHREEMKQGLVHHVQQMVQTIEAARREGLRDVWIQKSRKADTLLITATLMFGCFFELLIQGILPEDTLYGVIVGLSIFSALSFVFLFLCIWFTLKFQSRLSDFNIYNKSQIYICGKIHIKFEEFYECHCKFPAKLANLSFYGGTLCLILAASLYAFARFYIYYENEIAAFFYIGFTIFVLSFLFVLHWLFPTSTRDKLCQGTSKPTVTGDNLLELLETRNLFDLEQDQDLVSMLKSAIGSTLDEKRPDDISASEKQKPSFDKMRKRETKNSKKQKNNVTNNHNRNLKQEQNESENSSPSLNLTDDSSIQYSTNSKLNKNKKQKQNEKNNKNNEKNNKNNEKNNKKNEKNNKKQNENNKKQNEKNNNQKEKEKLFRNEEEKRSYLPKELPNENNIKLELPQQTRTNQTKGIINPFCRHQHATNEYFKKSNSFDTIPLTEYKTLESSGSNCRNSNLESPSGSPSLTNSKKIISNNSDLNSNFKHQNRTSQSLQPLLGEQSLSSDISEKETIFIDEENYYSANE